MKIINENGVSIDCTWIPDLWHIAQALKESSWYHKLPGVVNPLDIDQVLSAADSVYKTWHQAHALKDALVRTKIAADTLTLNQDALIHWLKVAQENVQADDSDTIDCLIDAINAGVNAQ